MSKQMLLTESTFDTNVQSDEQNLYLTGAFMRADYRNQNGRVYPKNVLEPEISRLQEQINKDIPLLGELDHPESSTEVSLKNASHQITELYWTGNEVHGKAKVLDTPNGNILKGLLESGVKVGVSSRATGNVNESDGKVNSLNIITPADCVASPSFGTYPQSIYERYNRMNELQDLAEAVRHDSKAQKYFEKEMKKFINDLFS